MNKPLAIDLFCGLGGWSEGLLAEGFDVIGFDIERHQYGDHVYPAHLVVQNVRTLHGSQFKDAALIVASPPCQEYSWMAMPWSLAKAKATAIRADTSGEKLAALNRLFNECFRIQMEASLAAGHHIPMIVENVRGAIPWVGRSRWNFGSFHLWGDVPALMPVTFVRRMKSQISCAPRRFSDRVASTPEEAHALHYRLPNENPDGRKCVGPKWDPATKSGAHGMARWTNPAEGTKQGGDWFAEAHKGGKGGTSASFGSKSTARKMASAMIAKIPLPLSRHIGRTFRPR